MSEALTVVRRVLDTTKHPECAAHVPHKYDDKYLMAETAGNATLECLLQVLEQLNIDRELLTTLKKYSPLPSGIKIRLGLNKLDKDNKVYLRVIDIANAAGIDYMTVHPKLAIDKSMAPVDHTALKEIIDKATVPIVGSGFVVDGPSAGKLLKMVCSAVIVARAAVGNPWIFEEIKSYLNDGTMPKVRKREDYADAWKRYSSVAQKYGTLEKFYEYHKKIFQLRMNGDLGYHAPSRILNG